MAARGGAGNASEYVSDDDSDENYDGISAAVHTGMNQQMKKLWTKRNDKNLSTEESEKIATEIQARKDRYKRDKELWTKRNDKNLSTEESEKIAKKIQARQDRNKRDNELWSNRKKDNLTTSEQAKIAKKTKAIQERTKRDKQMRSDRKAGNIPLTPEQIKRLAILDGRARRHTDARKKRDKDLLSILTTEGLSQEQIARKQKLEEKKGQQAIDEELLVRDDAQGFSLDEYARRAKLLLLQENRQKQRKTNPKNRPP